MSHFNERLIWGLEIIIGENITISFKSVFLRTATTDLFLLCIMKTT